MKRLNPDWVRSVTTTVNACPYFRLESMEIVELEMGRSRLEIEVQDKHLQPFGLVHGGVFSGLIDASGFWAVWPETPEGLGLTTVEMKLNYLAPAQDGRLIGLGRSIKLGRTLGLAEARIENQQGKVLAHGMVTLMVVPDLKLDGSANIPPKFL